MCLLNRCRFEETQLQLQTVAENFGLREVEVTRTLRSDRIDHPHEEMDHAAIEQSLALTTQPLSRLAFHYYLTGDLLSGSENLDAALDVGYWIKSQSTVGSFSIVLTRLCEFLLDLHENDELAYLPLVQLHSVTGALASAVPSGAHMRQAGFAVYGVHLSITRRINDWEILVRELVEMRRKTSTFLVEGKHTEAFYRRAIPELFMRNKPRIVSLVPHNSPWEMELGFRSSVLAGGFMALFLATRTRIELQRLVDTHQVGATTRRKSSKRSHTQIAQVTLGAAKAREVKPLLHLTTQLSPTLAAEFQLSVSTRCIGRVRKILLLWLK